MSAPPYRQTFKIQTPEAQEAYDAARQRLRDAENDPTVDDDDSDLEDAPELLDGPDAVLAVFIPPKKDDK